MKIGVVSDTHGHLEAWEKTIRLFSNVDMIIHAGDIFDDFKGRQYLGKLSTMINKLEIPFIAARGNCDSDDDLACLEFPVATPYAFLQVDSLRIIVNHSKNLREEGKLALAERWKAGLFVSGHTHIPGLQKQGGVTLLNPGSPAIPKTQPSAAVLVLDKGSLEIKIVDVYSGSLIDEMSSKV